MLIDISSLLFVFLFLLLILHGSLPDIPALVMIVIIQCSTTADCATGHTCTSGLCKKNLQQSCTAANECASGTCSSTVCKVATGANGCTTNADCASPSTLCTYNNRCATPSSTDCTSFGDTGCSTLFCCDSSANSAGICSNGLNKCSKASVDQTNSQSKECKSRTMPQLNTFTFQN